MDFNFLPNLPKSDLDDRTFQELVDECLLRIPRYCPEWTNYNPSDPGVTLIELFSWLTDQMLLRFNQVPRRNYVAFLEMLGIRLQPPAPAHTAVTFYLSASLPAAYQIPAGVEVATERTETEEAIIFSTDRTLTIGLPEIRHLLTAEIAETVPTVLRDRFVNRWTRQSDGRWEGREEGIFSDRPQPGNCLYVVFDPDQTIAGNVIALTLAGETATSTGINPSCPPRRWEAWDGQDWIPVLLQEADDQTRGFSFHEIGDGAAVVQAADVVLHLPQNFPITQFTTYQGYWIRCVCTNPVGEQSGYSSSPLLISANVRSIGGTIDASQCSQIVNETLGESDGVPGQRFQFQSTPVLPSQEGEYLRVIPPDGVPQRWQEVADFADSVADSRHYVLDSLNGTIQFGPLVREPGQAREVTLLRSRLQTHGQRPLPGQAETITSLMERQYGAVPPKGSTLQMVAYRTGGGRKGNVQPHTLRIVKSAVPYVAAVTNHVPARNGADAESLEEAVLRVPKLLRTRDRAVTPEDFEVLARQAGRGAIARSLCPLVGAEPGQVNVILVPQTNTDSLDRGLGIHPSQFELSPQLRQQVMDYLDERRLLGVQVNIHTPLYTGVSVQTEVSLEPQYNTPQAQQTILQQLNVALYRFLNPLTGGRDGMGWPFGTPVYPSDIISLVQGMPGVRYLGTVLLFELRFKEGQWVRLPAPENQVDPGPLGLICSWRDHQLRSAHTISLVA